MPKSLICPKEMKGKRIMTNTGKYFLNWSIDLKEIGWSDLYIREPRDIESSNFQLKQM
jgi:hypothetical protein